MKLIESRIAAVAALIIGLMFFQTAVAYAEYRLEPGDTIELVAVGIPDLKHRAVIGFDGEVTLPLVGSVKAAGLSIHVLRSRVQKLMVTKVVRRQGDGGREASLVLGPDQIVLSIAEYRPVYLNGDIAKPGEQPFRPGMTVLQAVALAGGYDILRFRMNNPFLELADIRGEYDSLWVQFAKDQATILRIRAELEGKPSFDHGALSPTPVPPEVVSRIVKLQDDQLQARNAAVEKERTYLEEAVAKEGSRLRVLGEQQKKEKAGSDLDAQELARLEELFRRGQTPITRVVEARRSILLSATRLLQTQAQSSTVERQRDELLQELQEIEVRLATTRSRLQAVGDKLTYTGMVRSQLVRGSNAKPEIIIVRKGHGEWKRLVVEENAELAPGDVVEVALQKFLLQGAGASPADAAEK